MMVFGIRDSIACDIWGCEGVEVDMWGFFRYRSLYRDDKDIMALMNTLKSSAQCYLEHKGCSL